MAYRNLTFRSLATDIRTETYLGEEHLVIPCIALVGDEVVYGMNAEGPEFIPADELELSTLGWGDRPVLYDHPPNSTASACEPRTLEAMSFGRTFFPRFEDKKLKLEAWCSKRRAKEIDQGELIAAVERGEVIELSVGVITSLNRKKGIAPNGKPYSASWFNVQSDHLAIGLQGSEGACNIEMGCGANRMLRANSGGDNGGDSGDSDDFRTMRSLRGDETMPKQAQPSKKPADKTPERSDKSPVQKILSFASRVFRSNAEDEGLSDFELRSKLWDVLYSIEPAFSGIEDVYQESKTVRYITQPTYPEPKMFLWRRTFNVAEDGTVTVNDDREEVDFAVNYIYLAGKETDRAKPCGCKNQTMSANETDNPISTETNNPTPTDQPKETDTMPAEKPKTDTTTPASTTTTTPPATTPAPTTTPPTGTPATDAPKEAPKVEPDPATPLPASTPGVTTEQLKALLEEHPVVKHYRAQEAREKSSLIEKLAKKQSVLSKEQLESKPIEELRTYAEFLGVNASQAPVADYSGRMMASAEDETEIKPVPKPWTQALKRSKTQSGEETN